VGDGRIDTSQAQPARRYNYWLGGQHHFPADRESGDAIEAAMPTIRLMAVENRRFLTRAARWVGEQGVRQFLDIGTGLPAPGGVADVVPASSRIVYTDNDPLVAQYAGALLSGASRAVTNRGGLPGGGSRAVSEGGALAGGGSRVFLEGDVREPRAILDHPSLRATLDLGEPVGLMLAAVLHFVRDDEDPQAVVRTLIDALGSGSYVVASHATWEYVPPEAVPLLVARNPGGRFVPRDGGTFAAFFDGLEPVTPGLTSVAHWHAESEEQPRPTAEDVGCHGLVLRVP
jgi:hypothetical protein